MSEFFDDNTSVYQGAEEGWNLALGFAIDLMRERYRDYDLSYEEMDAIQKRLREEIIA
jgi:hypothetical protein